MKKMLTVTGMIASIVIIISCSKDDKPSVAAGTFTMDGYTFVESSAKDTTSSDNLNVLSGEGSTSDKKKAIFAFIFTAKPTSSGEYRIYTDTLDSSLPASDQVAIFAEDSLSIAHEGLFTSGTGMRR